MHLFLASRLTSNLDILQIGRWMGGYRYIHRWIQMQKPWQAHITAYCTAQFFTDHTLVDPVSFPYLLLVDYCRFFTAFAVLK